jgi:molybdopterin converting factor small subunit
MPEVRLLGGLRDLMGESSVSSDAPAVRELLEEISKRGGESVAKLLYDEDGIAPSQDLRVLVNGRSVAFLAGLDTKLQTGDSVTLHLAGARGYPGG